MFDNNWRTWIVLVIAFVGGSFELLKHLPVRDSVAWQTENLKYGEGGKPYSVRFFGNPLKHSLRATHVAGDSKILETELKKYVAATAPTQTEVAHPADPAAAKAKVKKKKNEDDYDEVIDPVTGKKVKRKKKKDAKKDVKPTPVLKASDFLPPALDDKDANDAAAIAAAVSAAALTGDIPPPTKKSADPFASLQEWERLLLSRPDLSETKVFIQDYKNHTVSYDIYNKITQMMVADSRPEMKQLGLMCAGAAPSVNSFNILAGVAKGSGSSAALQTQATGFINQYGSNLSNLAILQGVLRGGNSSAEILAAQQVDAAAQRFLIQPTTPAAGTQSSTPANSAQFQPFLAIFQQLSQNQSDQALADQARQSLSNLQARLGSAGTANVLASIP